MKASTRGKWILANGITIASMITSMTIAPTAMLRSRVLIGLVAIVNARSRSDPTDEDKSGTLCSFLSTKPETPFLRPPRARSADINFQYSLKIDVDQKAASGGAARRQLSRGNSRLSPMSALGQKQTFQHFKSMSALPPKTDIGTQPRDVCFVPEADIRPFLLDHFISPADEGRRHGDAERSSGF